LQLRRRAQRTEVQWMTADSTRAEAKKKMKAFRVKIGYTDEFIEYATLSFTAGSGLLEMVLACEKFLHAREVKDVFNASALATFIFVHFYFPKTLAFIKIITNIKH
jgi:predicted metalloendopeptidase